MPGYKDKIIAVWGSPHSGKTTLSLKLGQALYEKTRASVVVLFCDVTTPALPILFPNHKTTELYSVGTVLSKTDIFANDVVSNLITVKERANLGFLGYKNKENRFSLPIKWIRCSIRYECIRDFLPSTQGAVPTFIASIPRSSLRA